MTGQSTPSAVSSSIVPTPTRSFPAVQWLSLIHIYKKLTYDIPYQARLIYACDYAYAMGSYDFFKGFLSGLHAGNYDITHVFVDNFTKMLSEVSEPQIAEFLAWLNDFSEREHIQFTLSLSMDPAVTGSEITKYMI